MNLRKIIYGVLAFWFVPALAVGIWFTFTEPPPVPGRRGNYAMYGVILVFIGGWIAYLWDVFHNPRVPIEKRALWAVVLVFVGPYAMPFYYWFYIRGAGPSVARPLPGPPPHPSELANDPIARALLPVGRSGWAIAAGYLGLFSILVLPAPIAIAVGVVALFDLRLHPDKLGMGRAVFALVMGVIGTVALVVLLGLGAHIWSKADWGNRRITDSLAQIRPSDVRRATVDLDRCPRQPVPIRPETVPALLAHLRVLQSAQTIGTGQSREWRHLVLDCGEKGHFAIAVGARPSLPDRAIVTVEQGADRREIGFYEGTAFWAWLRAVPESAALSDGPQPCK
ncbi:MAG: DUF4190 domain-containing protein [Acidobacteriota bacterium]